MQNSHEAPNSHLKRLTVLSKDINDAINEIISMAFAQVYQESNYQGGGQGPDIRLIEKNLWINSIMIPLLTRDKTFDLVHAFFRSDGLGLTKEEIIAAVYSPEDRSSLRYKEALDTGLTKLMSRTRKLLRESLEPVYLPFQLDWFPYDLKTKTYQLVRIHSIALKAR